MRWDGPQGYWVSDDRSLIDMDQVHHWLSVQSYWATGRPREVTVRAMENSLVLGLYSAESRQAGIARMVTDFATFAWLCDVFVAQEHRADGIGSFLVQTAICHPDVSGVRQYLKTRPDRTLYRRFGYADLLAPERWLERPGEGTPPAGQLPGEDPAVRSVAADGTVH